MTAKAKQQLYAIALERRVTRTRWEPSIEYLHADNIEEARLAFFNSEPPHIILETKVVGIAPVIGYFVDDDKGEKISA